MVPWLQPYTQMLDQAKNACKGKTLQLIIPDSPRQRKSAMTLAPGTSWTPWPRLC